MVVGAVQLSTTWRSLSTTEKLAGALAWPVFAAVDGSTVTVAEVPTPMNESGVSLNCTFVVAAASPVIV
jgi:hypothetical protein